MDPVTILAWVNAGSQLVAAGAATAANISAFIKSLHPGMSDDELNLILDGIIASAARHKALADADARG